MKKFLELLNGFSVVCVTMSFLLLFVSAANLVCLAGNITPSPFAQIVWIIIWIVASFRIGFALLKNKTG